MWIPQSLLAVVAACAAWIAFQQWATARLKLSHDLFERRFAVYVTTQDHIVTCLNSIRGDIGDIGPFMRALRVAPFLFDKKISEFLAEVWTHSATINVYGKLIDDPDASDRQKMMTEYHAAQRWLLKELQGSADRFYLSLSLTRIKPFPIDEALSFPDIDAIKSRLRRRK